MNDDLQTRIREMEQEIVYLRRKNEALIESEEKYRTIFETTGTATIVIEDNLIISMVNTEFEQLSGFSREEIEGKRVWTEFVQGVDLEMMVAHHRKRRQDPKNTPRTYECRVFNKWNEEKMAMMTVSLIPGTTQSVASVRDITERRRLEAELLRISEAERRKIGSDLHDDLGQHLVGIDALSTLLKHRLENEQHPEAYRAAEISELIREAITKTRNLARGLCPVDMDEGGLAASLGEFAVHVRKVFAVDCRFQCLTSHLFRNNDVATNLYHIAQEAVNNALRHGKAGRVKITLFSVKEHVYLVVSDNGCGMISLGQSSGLGLSIMDYRARSIGATLDIQSRSSRGTRVICQIHRKYLL